MGNCHICAQIVGDASNDLISRLLGESTSSYIRRIPIENDFFAVIPSLGPLVPGHVLICPKRHIKSTALLEALFRPKFDEFKWLVKNRLQLTYDKEVHFFEHGNAQYSATALCTVEHAHLHAFPVSGMNFVCRADQGIPWLRTKPLVENISHVVEGREYLYYEPPDEEAYVAITDNLTLGSQYFRKIVAKALGSYDLWNWRDRQLPTEADLTFRRLVNPLLSLSQI